MRSFIGDTMVREGTIDEADIRLLSPAKTAREAVEILDRIAPKS